MNPVLIDFIIHNSWSRPSHPTWAWILEPTISHFGVYLAAVFPDSHHTDLVSVVGIVPKTLVLLFRALTGLIQVLNANGLLQIWYSSLCPPGSLDELSTPNSLL